MEFEKNMIFLIMTICSQPKFVAIILVLSFFFNAIFCLTDFLCDALVSPQTVLKTYTFGMKDGF